MQEEETREMEEEAREMEVERLKKAVEETREEAKAKEKKIGKLEAELGKARQEEAGKDASLGRLMKELRDVRERENDTVLVLSSNKKRIQELEAEVERKRKSEAAMARQLDSAMFELEESKIEIASLHEKIDGLEDLCNHISKEVGGGGGNDDKEFARMKAEVVRAQEAERRAVMKAESLAEEMDLLRREWKFAMEGEDKSSKAMEDLAMALKEVATEANMVKEELSAKEEQVELLRAEVERLRGESELYANTAERLRAEAEETLFAWNAKEIGFVSCIKRAEEERALAQIENHKLSESLLAAENMTRAAREETYKLRDILKQAINESNAAKAAAGIARDENSVLKDCLAEKEEALHFITRENERLRISEAAAQEHVKQLKRMLTMAASADESDKDPIGIVMFADDHHKKDFSFDLEDLKFMNDNNDDNDNDYNDNDPDTDATRDEAEDEDEEEYDEALDEDPEKAEALKGSIFDTTAETPKSETKTTSRPTFFRLRAPSNANANANGEDENKGSNGEEGHDDAEGDKNQGHRRTKTMFQRVGGLLTIRKSFIHRKEPPPQPSENKSTTPTTQSQPSHL